MSWAAGDSAAECGFDPALPVQGVDDHTVTLRLRVLDGFANLGEDRRTVAIHTDPTLRHAPIHLPGSGESSAGARRREPRRCPRHRAGRRRRFGARARRRDGRRAARFPGPHRPAADPRVTGLRERRSAAAARVGDRRRRRRRPRRRRRVEIVVASIRGRLYVFDDHGQLPRRLPGRHRPGPLAAREPQPAERHAARLRGRADAREPRRGGAAPGARDPRERARRQPVRVARRRRAGGRLPGAARGSREGLDRSRHRQGDAARGRRRARTRAKSLSSPAVGDLDGDGRPEIVVATNEEYGNELQRLRDRVEAVQDARRAARSGGHRRLLARYTGTRLRGEARRQRRRGRTLPRRLAGEGAAAHAGRAADRRNRDAGCACDHRHRRRRQRARRDLRRDRSGDAAPAERDAVARQHQRRAARARDRLPAAGLPDGARNRRVAGCAVLRCARRGRLRRHHGRRAARVRRADRRSAQAPRRRCARAAGPAPGRRLLRRGRRLRTPPAHRLESAHAAPWFPRFRA